MEAPETADELEEEAAVIEKIIEAQRKAESFVPGEILAALNGQ